MDDSKKVMIRELVEHAFPSEMKFPKLLPLGRPVLWKEEKVAAVEALLDDWFPTMGPRVQRFESEFAGYIGSKHGVMLNSGSSANLVAVAVLKELFKIPDKSEVIVPAISWATCVAPIAQNNLIPSFVDIDANDFNISIESLRSAITPKTKMIMAVHTLGFPARMNEIMEIAKEHNLKVIEDTCESYGAEINGRKIGTFGDVSTASFYASHQMTTIEGGMLLTNDEMLYEVSKSIRSHGWVRDFKKELMEKYSQEHPKVDNRFMFVVNGYNLRSTEINAAIGSEQLKKLDGFIDERIKVAHYWNDRIKSLKAFEVHNEMPNTKPIWFGYPLTLKKRYMKKRKELIEFLDANGIENRPIISGNFLEQPILDKIRYKKRKVPNAKFINDSSVYIGCYNGIDMKRAEMVAEKIKEFSDTKL